ncbi:hypothetical protein M2146_002566 [Lachnospiraceae bacterium PF1-22]
MINSTEYQNVTYKQISDMKHAIGFDSKKVRGTKHRKYEPYRNYYNTGERDVEDWEMLVKLGFANKSRENFYHVSNDGRIFLERVLGVKILPESR